MTKPGEIDHGWDWGHTWVVMLAEENGKVLVDAWRLCVAGGALVFYGDGTREGGEEFNRAFAPGRWAEVWRAESGGGSDG